MLNPVFCFSYASNPKFEPTKLGKIKLLLLPGLNRTRPGLAYLGNGLSRRYSKLYQKPRSNSTGPTQSRPAVKNDPSTVAKNTAQLSTSLFPLYLESPIGYLKIDDGEMYPDNA